MKRIRAVGLILSILLLASIVIGCSSSGTSKSDNSNSNSSSNSSNANKQGNTGSDQQIELRFIWWGSQTRHDRTLEVIKMFEDQNPGVKISPEFTGGDEIFQRLATQAAGNNLPDIVQMDPAILSEYVERGLIRALDDFVADGTINLDDVHQSYIEGGKIGDQLYAISNGSTAMAMVIDPAMYEQAGVPIPKPGYTWEEWIDQAYTLKEKLGPDVYIRGMSGPAEFKQIYLKQRGQEFYNEDGTGLAYDDQHLIDFFTMWKKLIDDDVVAGPAMTAMIQGVEDELIVHGKAPNHAAQQPRIVFHSNQFIALSQAANRPLEMTIYPTYEGSKDAQYVKPSQFLSISTRSEHPEIAAQFISFFANSLEANEVLAAERGIPISSKVRQHLYETLDEAGKQSFDYLEMVAEWSGGKPFYPPGDSTILSIFDRIFDAMAFGQITPEEAAKQFRSEAEDVLKKNVK